MAVCLMEHLPSLGILPMTILRRVATTTDNTVRPFVRPTVSSLCACRSSGNLLFFMDRLTCPWPPNIELCLTLPNNHHVYLSVYQCVCNFFIFLSIYVSVTSLSIYLSILYLSIYPNFLPVLLLLLLSLG